jgi:hypothetical protein
VQPATTRTDTERRQLKKQLKEEGGRGALFGFHRRRVVVVRVVIAVVRFSAVVALVFRRVVIPLVKAGVFLVAFLFRGMRGLVNLFQFVDRDVRVDLRRVQVSVTEHRLNEADVGVDGGFRLSQFGGLAEGGWREWLAVS